MLKLAYSIACRVHTGQYDKGGQEYIRHPIAVANLLESDNEKIVAYLHDVVEDADTTLENLQEFGFEPDIIDAIDCITKRKSESYNNYLERVRGNKLATRVKIADLTHNSDISRIPKPTDEDFARVQKYKESLKVLTLEIQTK